MPLSVNVGLSKKRSKDFQSEGVSINLTAELDQSLLARPEELQQQIDGLYHQAEAALDRQVAQSPPPSQSQPQQRSQPNRNGGYNRSARYQGNGNSNGSHYPQQHQQGNGNGNGRSNGAGMTESQKRAINAIARRLNLDAAYECQQVFGWDLEKLSIKQASELIDHLKSQTSDDTRR